MKRKKQKATDPITQAKQRRADDPVKEAVELRDELHKDAERKFAMALRAIGEREIILALRDAMISWRRYAGFSHSLAMATGRTIYEDRRTPVYPEHLRKYEVQLRHGGLPVSTEAVGTELLEAIKKPAVMPTFFEGNDQLLQYFEEHGLVEEDPNKFYQSQTRPKRYPSDL